MIFGERRRRDRSRHGSLLWQRIHEIGLDRGPTNPAIRVAPYAAVNAVTGREHRASSVQFLGTVRL